MMIIAVILYTAVADGKIGCDAIEMLATNASGLALVGALSPTMKPEDDIETGEIGYIVTNLNHTQDAKVGDTVTVKRSHASDPLPGYQNVKPFVYAGFFPGIERRL